MKILIIGGSGYFGSNFKSIKHDISRPQVRIENLCNHKKYLEQFDCIINCAAKIDQDKAKEDKTYRRYMYKVNTFNAIELGEVFDGYIVHISSPFVFYPRISKYANSKYLAHQYYTKRKNSLVVIPAHPYGGENKNGFHAFLERNIDTELILDNRTLFNCIDVPLFCSVVFQLVEEGATGIYSIFEHSIHNKYTLAKKLFGHNPNWKEGVYFEMGAARPRDWTLHNIHTREGMAINHVCLQKREEASIYRVS